MLKPPIIEPPFILLDDQLKGRARLYQNPSEIISAYTAKDLKAGLKKLQTLLDDGHFIAGYLAYEAGFVLEPKLADRFSPVGSPLMLMGVFDNWSPEYPESPVEEVPRLTLEADWSEADYLTRFEKVINYIKAGDVYQINLTFPLISPYRGSPLGLYDSLRARQPVHYGGVISLDEGPDIVTFSPELFFEKSGAEITMRPMKGTAKRLRDQAEDQALRAFMRQDSKSQAENLMIVDLLRNDLSRIAKTGSVNVPHLFALETYPTLHQMTSTVTARLDHNIGIQELFKSLFPCGSVTGAPKIRAMEIIAELEAGPRNAYCGAIGYMDPGGEACFNVGIRTAIIENNELRYHVGSGVVLDSEGKAEYEECLLKAKVLTDIPSLVETFRWEPGEGIIRRKRHFSRLANSARALGYPYDELRLQAELQNISGTTTQKCRLILAENGSIDLEHSDLVDFKTPIKLALSRHPLSLGVQEYRHKVLARDFYESERRRISELTGCDEVVFLNPDGELCEGSFTSLFLELENMMYTPPLSSGLLPGILRSELIESGSVSRRIMQVDDLKRAEAVYAGNSLRGLLPAKFINFEQH